MRNRDWKNPDAGILLKYDADECFHIDGLIKGASRSLTKINILKPYVSEPDFTSVN